MSVLLNTCCARGLMPWSLTFIYIMFYIKFQFIHHRKHDISQSQRTTHRCCLGTESVFITKEETQTHNLWDRWHRKLPLCCVGSRLSESFPATPAEYWPWLIQFHYDTRHSYSRSVCLEINIHEAEWLKRQRAPDCSCSAPAKNMSAAKFALFSFSYERYVRVIFTGHTSDYPPLKFNHFYTETGPVEISKLNRRCHSKKQFYGSPTRIQGRSGRARPNSLATFVKCAVSACFPFPSDHKSTKTTRKNKAMDLIQTLTQHLHLTMDLIQTPTQHLHLTVIKSPFENGMHVTVNMNSRD
jgi:hypothetical protein